jgi:hypothetical protein
LSLVLDRLSISSASLAQVQHLKWSMLDAYFAELAHNFNNKPAASISNKQNASNPCYRLNYYKISSSNA